MSVDKKVWVYDLEQFENFHSGTFMNRDNPQEVRQFVIHELRNDIEEYIQFLENEAAGLIGFNNLNYDYPLLHFLMELVRYDKDARIVALLYDESKRLMRSEYSMIQEKYVKIPQLDLYRIHHFDNKAKRTSLKAVEIAIQFPHVQDLPFEPDHYVTRMEEIDQILSYNLNDVAATMKFYELSKDMVVLRQKLTKRFNINLRNANDPKIGQDIFGREIAKKKRVRYNHIKNLRTYRHAINLKDCLLDKIKFASKELTAIHDFFKKTTITTTYKPFEESVIYKGFKFDFGVGGLHGCAESGVYESDQENIIIDIDVASYYPSLAIQNDFYPQHLGHDFVEVYSELFDTRMKAKREGDKATNSGLKLALNGVYGKSNDQYSLFYDPQYTMKITINGQLLLAMLSERLLDEVRGLKILQVNTDGVTVRLPREEIDELDYICHDWQEYTGLILEQAQYQKMIIRDVNNYLAVDTNGNAKPKGCFEIIPMQNGAVAYNKNWSKRVVPKALHAYYIDGVPIEDFIRNHDNIYDFCIGFKSRGDWNVYYTYINEEGEKREEKQQKTVRYYVSKSLQAGVLTKNNIHDHRIIALESGHGSVLFNMYEEKEMKDYKIDYNYYIAEANKIKNAVDDGQLKMMF